MTIDFDFDLDIKTEASQVNISEGPVKTTAESAPVILQKLEPPAEKPILRQTNLQHYFTCPRKYKLALEHPDAIEPSMAMRHGLIFERFVLGEKPDHNEADFRENVYGRMKAPSIDFIKEQAQYTKPLFLAGEPYVKLFLEGKDFILKGEADFIGEILFEGEALNCIADLKYTSNIAEYWNKKEAKQEYLQSIVYPYLLFKATGQLVPFVYIIVEDSFAEPLIKQIRIDVKESDFPWIENVIDQVVCDQWFEAADNAYNCLGFKGFGKCQYMEWCEDGKALVCEPVSLIFGQLAESKYVA